MRVASVLATLLLANCTFDYAALSGHRTDGGTPDTQVQGDSQVEAADTLSEGSADVPTDTRSESPETQQRPLGAGCTSDDQCTSGICAEASPGLKACCDGKPDVCSPCVGGYLTAKPNGPTPDGCATCTDRHTTVQNEGKPCGSVATCGGPMFSSGFGDGSGLYSTIASNFACKAGACMATVIDCAPKACPACDKQYLGCFVDSPGDGGAPVSGAACRCVDKGGSFCTGPL